MPLSSMIVVRDRSILRRESAVGLGATAEATNDSREQNQYPAKVVQYNFTIAEVTTRRTDSATGILYDCLQTQVDRLKSVFEIETSMLPL